MTSFRCLLLLMMTASALQRPAASVAWSQDVPGSLPIAGRAGADPGIYPWPSLSPDRVFNPGPSLSPNRAFNPSGSYLRGNPAGVAFDSSLPKYASDIDSTHPWSGVSPLQAGDAAIVFSLNVAMLDEALDDFKNGDEWKQYLRLDDLLDVISDPSDDMRRDQLATIWRRFDAMTTVSEFQVVQSLQGFEAVRTGIANAIESAPAIVRQRLATSSQSLARSLQGLRGGEPWLEYLRVFPNVGEEGNPTGSNMDELARLEGVFKRYEIVRNNSQYGLIGSLPEFSQTFEQLTAYIAMLEHRLQTPLRWPKAPVRIKSD